MRALISRHFPQPDLSTVVAPSGGVQQTANRERGNGHRTANPPKNGEKLIKPARPVPGHLNLSPDPLFSYACPALQRLHFRDVQSLMGCKQYARMLWLSIGYPHILYLSLNKWDAAPGGGFSTRAGGRVLGNAHAGNSGRAELRLLKSEMGKSRRIRARQISPPPMGT